MDGGRVADPALHRVAAPVVGSVEGGRPAPSTTAAEPVSGLADRNSAAPCAEAPGPGCGPPKWAARGVGSRVPVGCPRTRPDAVAGDKTYSFRANSGGGPVSHDATLYLNSEQALGG